MLEVRLIGGFDIQCDGEAISIPSRAAQSLFAYLILTAGTMHRREKLAGMFWPDESEQKARTLLRNELWRIRKALSRSTKGEYFLADNLTIGFNPASTYLLDVAVLKSLSDAGSTEELMRALSNYQGELLPGFYEDWIVVEREHLQVFYEQKIACLLEILEKEQRWHDILEWGERWIALAQASEAAYRAIMFAHDALGDHVKVTSTYERCKQALRQLDLEPSEEMRALAFKRSSKFKIPIPLTSFIGRENELKEIADLFSKSRLITLTGSGGVGKTRLAIQVVGEVMDLFPDGIWLLDLASLNEPSLIPNSLATLLGLRQSADTAITELLISYFRSRTAVVIFDNCEHLIDASAQLINLLLTSCEHITILATSREALRVAGEIPYRVPSLHVPNSHIEWAVNEVANIESVKLFIERAVLVVPGFELNSQNALDVTRICERLDGIPLAIELAAARTNLLSTQQLLTGLDNRFRLLTHGLRSSLPRHQTLRAMIEWSYDLLTEKECTLFGRLAVFRGGWTLEAAQEVCSGHGIESIEVLDLLAQLVNKSLVLVVTSAGETRYGRLETISHFAREKLQETGDEEFMSQQHLVYFLQFAERAGPNLRSHDMVLWLDRLKAELPNLHAALDWTLMNWQEPNLEIGLRLVTALERFWWMRSFNEGRTWLMTLLHHPKGKKRTAIRARALDLAGDLTMEQSGDVTIARALYEESLSIHRELDDQQGVAASLFGLGMAVHAQGDLPMARSFYEQSLSIWRESGNKWSVSSVLPYLGFLVFAQGDLVLARSFFNECLAIGRGLNDESGIAWAFDMLGEVARYEGDYEQALVMYKESLRLHREVGSKWGIAALLSNMGYVALNQENLQLAMTLFKESLSLAHELGHKCMSALGLIGIAGLDIDPKLAALLLGAAEPYSHLSISPADRGDHDRIMAAVQAKLDEVTFAAAITEGSTKTLEQAVDYALRAF